MAQGVEVIQGDITQMPADAIVNAANTDLAMGGGVCGAIFRTAGIDALTDACNKAGYCPTGSAVLTPAFNIFGAKYIIHAVGPVHGRYEPEEAASLLRSAYPHRPKAQRRTGAPRPTAPARRQRPGSSAPARRPAPAAQ
jgi:O-acetyl-ADP-ribose deacetylase (regulator of RNase III)